MIPSDFWALSDNSFALITFSFDFASFLDFNINEIFLTFPKFSVLTEVFWTIKSKDLS